MHVSHEKDRFIFKDFLYFVILGPYYVLRRNIDLICTYFRIISLKFYLYLFHLSQVWIQLVEQFVLLNF
jgi:hypothetical protein